jgi:hypothetical protein
MWRSPSLGICPPFFKYDSTGLLTNFQGTVHASLCAFCPVRSDGCLGQTLGVVRGASASSFRTGASNLRPVEQVKTIFLVLLTKHYKMIKLQITRDVEMCKFFEQPPEIASPLPCITRVLKNTLNPNIYLIVTWPLEVNLDNRFN